MKATTPERIGQKLRNGMSVADLIEMLQDCDPAAKVVFQSDYKDYTHTQQLIRIDEVEAFNPDQYRIYETAYSESGLAVDAIEEDDTDGNDEQDSVSVVVLR